MMLFSVLRNWVLIKLKHTWNKNVIITPRVINYINQFILQNESPAIKKLWTDNLKLPLSYMQIDPSQARFLTLLIKAVHAKQVLEIGTFRGFSTINMAQALPDDGHIITCEISKKYAREARDLFINTGLENKITIEEGYATNTLLKLISINKKFDMIFIDADKENYQNYFFQAQRLISPNGIILIDNTLWASMVTYKNSGNRTAETIKAFNEFIFSEMGKLATIIPAWDGMTIVVMPPQ